MRKLSPAYVVTSIVIAAAGPAFAASGTVAGGASTARTALSSPAPAAVSPSGGVASPANAGITATTNATAPRVGSTSLDGSRSGNNTDNSAANTPIGSTSANGTTSASSSGPVSTIPALAPGVDRLINPAILNGTLGAVPGDGERTPDNSAGASDQSANAIADAQLQYNGTIGAAVAADSARSSQNLDRAIREVEKERKKIGRNGQLLKSIAPRTNVDRTREMPDDGPSPALSGTSSTLAGR